MSISSYAICDQDVQDLRDGLLGALASHHHTGDYSPLGMWVQDNEKALVSLFDSWLTQGVTET